MGRITITNQQKLTILRDADTRMADGESLKSVAQSQGIQPVQICSWCKIRGNISVARGKARSVSKGRPSSIKHLEEQVIGWALDLHHAGVGLSYRHLQVKACRFDPEFAARTDSQQYQNSFVNFALQTAWFAAGRHMWLKSILKFRGTRQKSGFWMSG